MSLQRAARNALKICLAVRSGEEVLIVTDWQHMKIAKALYEEALKLQAEPMIELMQPRVSHGAEPPATVAQAMAKADVVIAPTEKSLSHTDARRQACDIHKTRIASLPTITEEVFIRGLLADYDEVRKISQKVHRLVTAAGKVRLTSPQGTNLTMEIPNEFELESGLIRQPGAFSNLPDGEVCAAPKEGSTNGVLVIDRYENMIIRPTRVEIKNGRMQKIEQNAGGKKFQKLLDEARRRDKNNNAYNIAELGIGTNPSAKITGCVLEDEKVFGTIHIAFGDNTSYDGGKTNASCHEDVSVFAPSLELDGKTIMDKGKLL